MIIKIQRPLSGPEDGDALIYNEDRDFMAFLRFALFEPLFGPNDLKIYAMAEVINGVLHVSGRIKDQDF